MKNSLAVYSTLLTVIPFSIVSASPLPCAGETPPLTISSAQFLSEFPGCPNTCPLGEIAHADFAIPLSVLTSESLFLAHLTEQLVQHPASQHELLANLLYSICNSTSLESLQYDYNATSCAIFAPVILTRCTRLSPAEAARVSFMFDSIDIGSDIAVRFCDTLFPAGWGSSKGEVVRSDLTNLVENICQMGRQNNEKSKKGKAKKVGKTTTGGLVQVGSVPEPSKAT